MIDSGKLCASSASTGSSGVTANPAIFEKAISPAAASTTSRSSRGDRRTRHASAYETLAVEDVRAAADVLRPVFEGDSQPGDDGA